MANDDPFGMTSFIWTEVTDRAIALSRRIEAGYSFVNPYGPSAMNNNGPFDGFKISGIGRNFGYEGVTLFHGYHSISGGPRTLF
tara:strand:+ start:339 stop:590 length:252 start_codon:yes stop_codon:yes gene_type:complete